MNTRTKILIASIGGALALGLTGGAVASMGERDHMGKMGAMGAMFGMIDGDGDGKVARAEVEAFHAAQMAKFDADGDGSLNAAEHMAMMEDMRRQMMQQRFMRADTDGDGKLSQAEMATRMDRMFEHMDGNEDGVIEQGEMRGDKRHGDDDDDRRGHYQRK